jgi:hypothetical protein
MHELSKLFVGVKHPSVHIFRERIAGFSPEKQRAYLEEAFRQALCGFDRHSKGFQTFFLYLVNTYLQEFATFLREKTIIGHLLFHLSDKELVRKVVYRMVGKGRRTEASRKRLAFALTLSFDYDLKISTLSQYMKTDVFDAVDLAETLLTFYVR